MPTEVRHWSYSSLKLFEECARRWYYEKILKLPQPPNPYFIRGNEIHDQMEAYIMGRTERPRIDVDLAKPIQKLIDKLETYDDLIAEEMWHFDVEWGWVGTEFSYESWLLAKLDVISVEHRHIVDWKSGKIYDEHENQGVLYAVAASSRTFDTEWRVDMAYLDQGVVITYDVDTSDLAGAQNRWKTRADKIFEAQKAKEFPVNPGRNCKRCPFRASKDGPCSEG